MIGAGQYNGQFVFFDDRKGPTPVEASPIEYSHKDPIYDCAWLASKTVTEMLTCSTDGQVFVWDTRRISEPVESLMITEKGQNTVLGAVSLEYDAAAGASKFMVGTEQGSVVTCNMKGKNQSVSQSPAPCLCWAHLLGSNHYRRVTERRTRLARRTRPTLAPYTASSATRSTPNTSCLSGTGRPRSGTRTSGPRS